ncbi:hypothetical protein CsSME_00022796 [Camellia sinensis var. sinensis]
MKDVLIGYEPCPQIPIYVHLGQTLVMCRSDLYSMGLQLSSKCFDRIRN